MIVRLERKDRNLIGDAKMMIPVRCFSCGKPIAHLWDAYKDKVAKGKSKKEVMTELGLERYCCRSVFLSHVDLIDEVAKFKKF